MNSLKKEKAFIFIDPYGYKDISVKDILALLSSGKTEVLLLLPTQFMFRFETKGTPESLKEFINELVPEEQWPKSETGVEFIEHLRDAFRKVVGKHVFVDSFITTRDKNQFFCLFFFTSHIYGFDRMLDAKWQIDAEEGRGWYYEELSLFNQQPKKPNTIKLEKSLLAFLKNTLHTNGEVYEFTIRNGHRTSHANDILRKAQGDGYLEMVAPDEFFIGYLPEAAEKTSSFLRWVLVGVGAAVVIISLVLVNSQRNFSVSEFDYGKYTTLEGHIFNYPVPHLKLNRGLNSTGKTNDQTLLLEGFGKAGANKTLTKFESELGALEGKFVKISGQLIHGHGKALLQLSEDRVPEVLQQQADYKNPSHLNEVEATSHITGEIVDPKCFFGVMKPGEGKPHRSCAIRCIAGGIPPFFMQQETPIIFFYSMRIFSRLTSAFWTWLEITSN